MIGKHITHSMSCQIRSFRPAHLENGPLSLSKGAVFEVRDFFRLAFFPTAGKDLTIETLFQSRGSDGIIKKRCYSTWGVPPYCSRPIQHKG